MNNDLITYLQDHLAGARAAVGLLTDLESQRVSLEAAKSASHLLKEIQSDREILERIVSKLGGQSDSIKELSAWIAQKTGRLKFSFGDRLGVFEAVEFMSIGVLGKKALWKVLEVVQPFETALAGDDFPELINRAQQQFALLETLRIQLAVETFRDVPNQE